MHDNETLIVAQRLCDAEVSSVPQRKRADHAGSRVLILLSDSPPTQQVPSRI